MIIRAFEKCGISVPIDGSGDNPINIKGLTDYTVEEEEEALYDSVDSKFLSFISGTDR